MNYDSDDDKLDTVLLSGQYEDNQSTQKSTRKAGIVKKSKKSTKDISYQDKKSKILSSSSKKQSDKNVTEKSELQNQDSPQFESSKKDKKQAKKSGNSGGKQQSIMDNYPLRASFLDAKVKHSGYENDDQLSSRTGSTYHQDDEDNSDQDDNTKNSILDNRSDSGTSDFSTYTGSSASETSTRAKLIKRTGCRRFCLHLKLLLQKNIWLFKRNLKVSISMLAAHIFFIMLILFFQWSSTRFFAKDDLNPVEEWLKPVPHCTGDPSCTTIGYSIIGDPQKEEEYDYINEIMEDVALQNVLIFKKDVKLLTIGEPDDFYNYLNNNPNMTWYSVVWCTSEWKVNANLSIPCKFSYQSSKSQRMMFYTLFYNYTLADTVFMKSLNELSPVDPKLLQIKNSIDNSILKFLADEKQIPIEETPKIKMSHSSYPRGADRFVKNSNVVSQMGAYFFMFSPLLGFSIFLNEIVREKELKLRQGLQVVGVGHSVYWLSWFIVSTTFSAMCTLILCLLGLICQMDLFVNTPFLMLYLLFVTFAICMNLLAFLLSTLINTQQQAYSLVFAQSDVNNIFFFNDETQNLFAIRMTRYLLYLVPTFPYSICYGAIQKIACTHLEPQYMAWFAGKHYTWDMFAQDEKGHFGDGIGYTVPSPLKSLWILIADCILFAFLAWYFDHIISSNRGVSNPAYFLFTKKYWKSLCHKQVVNQDNKVKRKKKRQLTKEDLGEVVSIKKDSVKKEKRKVLDSIQSEISCDGLRVIGLRKTYAKKSFGRKSKKDIKAVRGIYLEIPDRELLCLLGHNGAGKSTLFGMLTGIVDPTSGHAQICGFDVQTQQDEIRQIMGVVPQFDILWGDLTANEHMKIFSQIKGIPSENVDKITIELLEDVGLLDVRNARVSSFSGGMKRRLSVAISAIGDPRIIFMDEPTTGMDPMSRKDVWSLIQKLKRNKVIILTTHAMEEADVLSDRIALISEGKLKCVGTPLYLKNAFGDGYRISFIRVEVLQSLQFLFRTSTKFQ
eukprot:403368176